MNGFMPTNGGLLDYEMRATLALAADRNIDSWVDLRRAAVDANVPAQRTLASTRRVVDETVRRLKRLNHTERKLLTDPDSTGLERRTLCWIALCRAYPFVGECARDSFRDAWLLDPHGAYTRDMFDRWWRFRALWLDAEPTEGAVRRMRGAMFHNLRETGMLDWNDRFDPPLYRCDFEELLRGGDIDLVLLRGE